MDYKDFKTREDYELACNIQCAKYHEANRQYFLKKVEEKKHFKNLWRKFYGLVKNEITYNIYDEDGHRVIFFFSEYDAENYLKYLSQGSEHKFRIEELITPKEEAQYELSYSSPYNTLKYKLFLSWVRKIENKGMILKRPWYEYHLEYWPATEYKYSNKWIRATRFFRHKYHNMVWDASDSFDEIIRVTIAGVYHWRFGHIIEHRQTAHQMWVYRKLLLKALDFDTYWEFENVKKPVLEKYKIPYEIEVFDEDNYIKNGINAIGRNAGKYFHAAINPILVERIVPRKTKNGIVTETNSEYRKRVLDKVHEIENFCYETRVTNYGFEKLREDWKKAKMEAYSYRAEYEDGWND